MQTYYNIFNISLFVIQFARNLEIRLLVPGASKNADLQFAQRYPEALGLIYQENLSLSGIAEIWGIQWIKAQRILKLEDFVDIVQYRTEEVFLDKLLKLINKFQSTQISNEPEKLKKIAQSIRKFALNKTFKEAKAELVASKTRVKNSLFAQTIRILLSDSRNIV